MRPNRIVAIVVGSLLLLPSLALLLGGGALAAAYAFARDDDGYFDTSVDAVTSPTAAVTAEDLTLSAEPGSPDWLLDLIEADVRLRVTSSAEAPVFVGIGPEVDVDAYLAGVAHDEVTGLDGNDAVLSRRAGSSAAQAPTDQDLWVASASGSGTQQLDWEAADGRWAVVLMNADGSPGVEADVDVGVRVDGLLPLAVVLGGVGLVLTALAVVLIVFGASGRERHEDTVPVPPVVPTPPPVPRAHVPHPVSLEAHLDPGLSRWQWLVKWFLAIPHVVVLVFLWIAFVVVTVVAGFSILFTGRYPRQLFDFNVGVLRWTWRVTYYATTGGIGTDVYPPFSLAEEPGYPATLAIEYPAQLDRGLVLVKWWLLAIPHYLVVGVLLGGAWIDRGVEGTGGLGLLTVLTVIAGFALLFRARYPQALFDLIVGLNRWIFRVVAYAALMTDEYPPFRLDQGGSEPAPTAPGSGPAAPEATAVDLGDTEDTRTPVPQ
jgi:hypothetical protein